MDVPLSKAVLQIDVIPSDNAKFQSVLGSGIMDDTLDTVGCHFTHGEVFKVDGGEPNRTIILLHSKSLAGIEQYKKSFSGILLKLAELGQSVTFTTTVITGFRKFLPTNKPSYQSRENVEPKLFSNRRALDQEVFNGALGLRSDQIETTTNRFTDFHVHKQMAPENHVDSETISKTADVETRFFEPGQRKKTATVDESALGITTKEKDFRDPANRFEQEGQLHFGQIDPHAGPGIIAGVTAKNQPHEIDRFDSPRVHYGQSNPNDGTGKVAGVTAKNQPHEIDRFDAPKLHHGTIDPHSGPGLVAGVIATRQPHEIDRFDSPRQRKGQANANVGPGLIAGVSSTRQPHEIDRFDNPVQHYGQLNPLSGADRVAGVTKEKQPHEIDRFDQPVRHLGAKPMIGNDFAGTPTSKAVREPIDRFDKLGSPSSNNMSSPSGRIRQPPGGSSTFTFG